MIFEFLRVVKGVAKEDTPSKAPSFCCGDTVMTKSDDIIGTSISSFIILTKVHRTEFTVALTIAHFIKRGQKSRRKVTRFSSNHFRVRFQPNGPMYYVAHEQ